MTRGGYPGAPQEDIGLLLWSEQRAKEVRASCGLLRDLNTLIKNTRTEAATALIFRSSDVLSVDFNLQSDEVRPWAAGVRESVTTLFTRWAIAWSNRCNAAPPCPQMPECSKWTERRGALAGFRV